MQLERGAKPTLTTNFISALTALARDLCSQKFVVRATFSQICLFEEGAHLVRIITVIICCLKSLAAPRASHWTKPCILITSIMSNTTVINL